MAEPEDPDFLPTQPWEESAESELAPAVKFGSSAPPPPPRHGRWQAPTPEEVQRSFPQYEIGEIIGQGGMGAVYKGWQKSLHRFVAIKILPPGIEGETTNYAERFQREARAMARFQHPCIVAVYDAGETPEGLLYYIMEYIEGTDVQKMIKATGRLPSDHALAIALQVCDALAYAHRNNVIHRDIKPSNVMMERGGAVKVADFGLAKLTSEDASLLTGTHMTMGTPDFIAPEALGGMENADHRADVYAMGVMLYQMLTGELPRGIFDMPSKHTPGLDVRFDAIIDRAMQKNPDRRYPSAVDLRSDLEHIRSGTRTNPSTSAQEARPSSLELANGDNAPPKARGPLYAGLAAAAVVVTLGGIFVLKQNAKPRGTASPTPVVERTATPTPGTTQVEQAFAAATKEAPLENLLGMRFVPVPITGGPSGGQRVLFSIWETRVQDYAPFVKEKGVEWPKPRYNEPGEPAVNITWDEAREFCDWLTEREQKTGQIAPTMRYRLPSDHEWSCAVGLGERENPEETPEEKNRKNLEIFPWGTAWPPPSGAGNYSGEESIGEESWPEQKPLTGYRDDFPKVAPVGSLAANPFGIFDLGGNVHEWCEDFFRPAMASAVLRGASFVNHSRENLRASYRLTFLPYTRMQGNGFRVVLAKSPTVVR